MANTCFIATYTNGRKEYIYAPNYYEACRKAGPNASVAIAQSYGGDSDRYPNHSNGSRDTAYWYNGKTGW